MSATDVEVLAGEPDDGEESFVDASSELAISDEVLDELKQDARNNALAGIFLFIVAFAAGLFLLHQSMEMTEDFVGYLGAEKDNPTQMMVLLLVRGTFFGAVAVGFLYGLFTVANACIDQSTRFRKRLYSAQMLNYAFRTFSAGIVNRKSVTLPELVSLFTAWNESVDSAFSKIKFQGKSKDLSVGGRDGLLNMRDPRETNHCHCHECDPKK